MKLKMKILVVMGSLMLLVFALNLGVASAHGGDGFSEAPDLIPITNAMFPTRNSDSRSLDTPSGGPRNAELKNPNCGAHQSTH